jgi:uncharacterized protein
MKNKLLFHFLLSLLFFSLSTEFLSGQKVLDHEKFLERMEHSSDDIYKDCLKEYDSYLSKFPDSVSVWIEKCKFIQYAQYDEDEEYNPNQDEFDTCAAVLSRRFPENPDVLLFRTTYLWGDELKEVNKIIEQEIGKNSDAWSKTNQAIFYSEMASQCYDDSDNKLARIYIEKAISNDEKYRSSLLYVRILIELDKKEEALNALLSVSDTTQKAWELSQKASLLLELKSYSNALELYSRIDKIDSTYNNNFELASTLEGVGQYNAARKYLINDTSRSWQKETAVRNLLRHDLKYQDGSKCIVTYNKFRDFGYKSDPFAIYRLKLFLSHPLQPWRLRDFPGLLSLLLLIVALLIIPSVWILPVYFIGHHFKLLDNEKPFVSNWGLMMFWFVSAGYLVASLFGNMVEPENIYKLISSSYSNVVMTQAQLGLMTLIFMITMAVFALVTLYKVNHKILLCNSWSISKSIFTSIGILFIFRLVAGIYIQIGAKKLGISIDELTAIPQLLLSSRQDIDALITSYGKIGTLVLVALLAPVYEEILFRGVILESCQRYINIKAANVFQAVLFSTIHMNLFLFPVFFLFGLIAGQLRKNSGGLLPGIVFHIVNNLSVLLVLFFK